MPSIEPGEAAGLSIHGQTPNRLLIGKHLIMSLAAIVSRLAALFG